MDQLPFWSFCQDNSILKTQFDFTWHQKIFMISRAVIYDGSHSGKFFNKSFQQHFCEKQNEQNFEFICDLVWKLLTTTTATLFVQTVKR